MEQPKHIDMQTPNGAILNLDALYKIAPSCITEAKGEDGEVRRVVDFNKLRLLLGDQTVEDAPEVYDFTWVGKRAALQEAAAPINKTLRPCPEESVDWETTQNLYIEGDNLEVLKLLQNSYMGKVKMIYIDPPYNTGNDFVYHDDFHRTQREEDEAAGVINEEGERMVKNTESNGKFHSDWCSMIYARLMVARSLLKEDGYICISIDDNEIENVKKLAVEVFGESNFVAQFIIIRSEGGGLAKRAVIGHDYMVVFAKSIDKCRPLGKPKDIRGKIVQKNGEDYWIETDWFREVFGKYGTCHYEDILKFYNLSKKEEIDAGIADGSYVLIPRDGKHIVGRYRRVAEDTSKFYTILKHLNKNGVADLQTLGLNQYFDYPKPVSLVKEFIQGATILSKNSEDIILDFFSGSSTTAQAVMQMNGEDGGNRKFIMIQLPEETEEKSEAYKAGYKNICEIGKERIRRAGKKIKEEMQAKGGNLFSPSGKEEGGSNLDTGFRVFKCESSNYKDVAFAPKDYSQDMLAGLLDNIKDDRSDLDLLFDCMLRWGVELSLPLESLKMGVCTIHNVNDGDLVACFDGDVTEEVIDAIAALSPVRVVFRDSSFNEAAQKMNLFELFKQKCDWSDEEVKNNVRVI